MIMFKYFDSIVSDVLWQWRPNMNIHHKAVEPLNIYG